MEPGILADEGVNVACIGQEDKFERVCRDRPLTNHVWRDDCAILQRHRLTRSEDLEVILRLAAKLGSLLR